MKHILIFTLAVISGILFQACTKSESLETEQVFIQLNEKGKKLVESSANFGIDLFKKVGIAEKDEKNWMISPLSVSLALTMTYNGADGETKTAMENTLRLNGLSTDEINVNFKQISEALLDVDKNVDISIANSIWYRNSFSVLQNFISVNEDFYAAKVSALDFNESSAKDIINSWVANQTNQKIKSIVDKISSETVMFLINAIYFKGAWKYEFDAANNYHRTFNYEDGSSEQIEMMKQTASFKQFVNEDLSMVELPYGRGNWVMDLLLPAGNMSANELLAMFSEENWSGWINELSDPTETTINFPPFKFEYEKALNEILKSMGMGIAFNPHAANFSKINTDGQIFISNVKHKTFIEVNEVGTEAAAVTSVDISVTSSGGGSVFVFDKPFLFVIREVSTGTILFIGKVGDPKR